jgi:hypothetical protein
MFDNLWQRFITWLGLQFQALIDALDVTSAVLRMAGWLAGWLPAANPDVPVMMQEAVNALYTVIRFITWLDFFINLRVLIFGLLIVASIEALLLGVRIWRFIRSFIT